MERNALKLDRQERPQTVGHQAKRNVLKMKTLAVDLGNRGQQRYCSAGPLIVGAILLRKFTSALVQNANKCYRLAAISKERCLYHVVRSYGRVTGRELVSRKSTNGFQWLSHTSQYKVWVYLSLYGWKSSDNLRPPKQGTSFRGLGVDLGGRNDINRNFTPTFLFRPTAFRLKWWNGEKLSPDRCLHDSEFFSAVKWTELKFLLQECMGLNST